MNPLDKELESRRGEIEKELKLLFKANLKITDWDIPELDEAEASVKLLQIFKEALDKIESEIKNNS